jgi:hypothetical protein
MLLMVASQAIGNPKQYHLAKKKLKEKKHPRWDSNPQPLD